MSLLGSGGQVPGAAPRSAVSAPYGSCGGGLDQFDFYGASYDAGGARLGGGQIVACFHILDDEEVLCLFNSHESEDRCSDVLVEGVLNWPEGKGAYLEIRDLAPSQVLMLASHPEKEEGAVV